MTASAETSYELTLFVSGASALSTRAIDSARQLCETHLKGRYQLAVVDVHEDSAGSGDQVRVTPTLMKNRPEPVRRLVGNLSNTDRVLSTLELPAADDTPGRVG